MIKKIVLLVTVFAISCPSWAISYAFTSLVAQEGAITVASDINDQGQVVGVSYYPSSGVMTPILWTTNTTTYLQTLDPLDHRIAYPSSINNDGIVVGTSWLTGNPNGHATLWNGNSVINLGVMDGGVGSSASAINNAGIIAGTTSLASGYTKSTLWLDTKGTNLGTPDESSSAMDINDAGLVVGQSNITGDFQAALWNGTTTIDLGNLGGFGSSATAINNAGLVVGWSSTIRNGSHATLWDGTSVIDLGTLGGRYSTASDINDSGLVVGSSGLLIDTYSPALIDTYSHATLWNGNSITDLNTQIDACILSSGWLLTEASAINNLGWIVGETYNFKTKQKNAFLLTPTAVPIPAAIWLFLSGLTGLIAVRNPKALKST